MLKRDRYNYMLLFDPLFTLDLFVVLFLRPESFFYLPADSFISISAYHLGLVEYAFKNVAGKVARQTHELFE